MAYRHMKRCSTTLAIREMQIRTTVRYLLTPVRVAIINKVNKQQVLVKMWRKGIPSVLLVGIQTGAATVENSMEFPEKIQMVLPFDSMITLVGKYPKNPETPVQKNVCIPSS